MVKKNESGIFVRTCQPDQVISVICLFPKYMVDEIFFSPLDRIFDTYVQNFYLSVQS